MKRAERNRRGAEGKRNKVEEGETEEKDGSSVIKTEGKGRGVEEREGKEEEMKRKETA